MSTHDLKTWPDEFQAIWDGAKLYELRRDDRGFNLGDQLRLREWSPRHREPCSWLSRTEELQAERSDIFCTKCGRNIDGHTVGEYLPRVVLAEVVHVLKAGAFPGLQKGFVILGIKVLARHETQERPNQLELL